MNLTYADRLDEQGVDVSDRCQSIVLDYSGASHVMSPDTVSRLRSEIENSSRTPNNNDTNKLAPVRIIINALYSRLDSATLGAGDSQKVYLHSSWG